MLAFFAVLRQAFALGHVTWHDELAILQILKLGQFASFEFECRLADANQSIRIGEKLAQDDVLRQSVIGDPRRSIPEMVISDSLQSWLSLAGHCLNWLPSLLRSLRSNWPKFCFVCFGNSPANLGCFHWSMRLPVVGVNQNPRLARCQSSIPAFASG